MGRKARFSKDEIAQATIKVICQMGIGALTISSISRMLGAPTGSIYYRYKSIGEILAETWIGIVKSFQKGFLDCLKNEDVKQGGLDGALYTPGWSRENQEKAQVLLSYRRKDLMSEKWPESIQLKASKMNKELMEGVDEYIKRRFGKPSTRDTALTRFAIISMPYSAVRPYLDRGEKIEPYIDDFVRTAYIALMERKDENQQRT